MDSGYAPPPGGAATYVMALLNRYGIPMRADEDIDPYANYSLELLYHDILTAELLYELPLSSSAAPF